jgi:hypothetical protein
MQILREVLEPADAAGVTALFFAFLDSTNFEQRLATGVWGRQTSGDILLSLLLDVIPELVLKVLVCLSSAK